MYTKDHESEEMYLETILILKNRNGKVRSCDIVEELNYAKSSVSRGVNLLEDNGYIVMNHETGAIALTDKGLDKAEGIFERHQLLTKILIYIGADKTLAEESACRIEHVISDELFEIIKSYIKKVQKK